MTNLFRAMGMAAWSFRSAFACALRGRIWLPFLLIALIQALILVALLNWHRPALTWITAPVLEALGTRSALRYPVFFLALPSVYSQVVLIVTVLLTCVLVGAAMILFAQAYGRAPGKPAWSTSWSRYPRLLAVTAVLAALLYGTSYLRVLVPNDAFLHNPMLRWGTRGTLLVLTVLVQSLLAYAALWVVLRGRGILGALRDSVRLAGSVLVPTFLVIGIPAVLLYPLSFLASRGDLFINKFRPETITALLSLRIGLEMIIGFLIVGAITRIFLYQTEEARA